MSEFLYLYRGGQRGRTPEQSQQIMQKWLNWMKELTASGNPVTAQAAREALARVRGTA